MKRAANEKSQLWNIDLYLSSPGRIDIIHPFWRIVLFHEFLSVNCLLSAAYFLNKILAVCVIISYIASNCSRFTFCTAFDPCEEVHKREINTQHNITRLAGPWRKILYI